jgi:nucleotide-binding universal stress UspA family protein
MTTTMMQTAPLRSAVETSQVGPVLLAVKPTGTLGAPLAVASWLAAREDRELRIVSVLEPTPAVVSDIAGVPPLSRECLETERAAVAHDLSHELRARGAIHDDAHVDVLDGPTLHPIVERARQCEARVIVIGSGRHEPMDRLVHGERALQILGLADRPVLVVPPSGIAMSIDVAVVATDFTLASVRAARAVLPMLSRGGRLIVVHVKTGLTRNEETAAWWNDAYERRCADRLAQFVRQLPTVPGITVDTKFLRGSDAARTIVEYAAAQNANVIACGRLGHPLLQRVFVGSVSSALVRRATCPVLVAPENPGDADAR